MTREPVVFALERKGIFRRSYRLRSTEQLSAEDFQRVAAELASKPIKARKVGRVAAHRSEARTRVETRWDGKESENVAEPGDWIVTSLRRDGTLLRDKAGEVNSYVIKGGKFAELYEPTSETTEFGAVYQAKGVVEALWLAGGFELKAPWGEMQRAEVGYLVLNGAEVYGNHRDVFDATYAPIETAEQTEH